MCIYPSTAEFEPQPAAGDSAAAPLSPNPRETQPLPQLHLPDRGQQEGGSLFLSLSLSLSHTHTFFLFPSLSVNKKAARPGYRAFLSMTLFSR